MADKFSKEKRSEIMSKVRSKDTSIEMVVRRYLHSQGFRYKLHDKSLLGSPDIVLPKFKSIIFVNGCFWHHHYNCSKATFPSTNVEFWTEKIMSNVLRDQRVVSGLRETGWRVLIIWECEVDNNLYQCKIGKFLR